MRGKHLNAAYGDLQCLPERFSLEQKKEFTSIDITGNKFRELCSLRDYTNLHTIVCDDNQLDHDVIIPPLPRLRTLSLNNNLVSNLSVFADRLGEWTPGLRHLSMMKNEAAPSYFNGGTRHQYLDYRQFVVSYLPLLESLDGEKVTEEERQQAYQIYGRRFKVKRRRSVR